MSNNSNNNWYIIFDNDSFNEKPLKKENKCYCDYYKEPHKEYEDDSYDMCCNNHENKKHHGHCEKNKDRDYDRCCKYDEDKREKECYEKYCKCLSKKDEENHHKNHCDEKKDDNSYEKHCNCYKKEEENHHDHRDHCEDKKKKEYYEYYCKCWVKKGDENHHKDEDYCDNKEDSYEDHFRRCKYAYESSKNRK
ncbi:hypothetical protein [Clostridium nigeriense]|uniref:hypothetical protein n=1 Tax=Clostridium nigeriense TaxID=1805470 RepID=UPI0008373BB4|nr:hypothetical protein [Clostridium nigeriense]